MKKAIVLGGTFPHRHLISRLKERGYHTILVDYYANPIAKDLADEHIQASTLDKEAVLQIAKDNKVDLVITTCVDQANVTACYVAEKLGLPHPYSYQTSINVTDKEAMKRIMTENGIPTAKYYRITALSQFDHTKLEYPLIVKPADCNSSKGVRKIESYNDQTLEYISEALQISRNGAAIIEEYKIGKEIGVDCMIVDHKPYIIMTKDRRKIYHDTGNLQQIYGSRWPAELTPEQLNDLKNIAGKIARAFNLNNCPLMMQAIISNDEINIIEFGARIGGGESFRIIKEMTGFDYIDQSINSFLNQKIEIKLNPVNYMIADNYIYTTGGIFGKIHFNGCCTNSIMYQASYRKEGTETGAGISSNNRVGVFVVKGKDETEIDNKIRDILSNMEVFDIQGKPIMRREIY